jgi:hypothetical protein
MPPSTLWFPAPMGSAEPDCLHPCKKLMHFLVRLCLYQNPKLRAGLDLTILTHDNVYLIEGMEK